VSPLEERSLCKISLQSIDVGQTVRVTISATQSAVLEGHRSSSRSAVPIFAITSFLSAFLLFQVQLIVSKYILPWFGGSGAVWTTSMLVFQVLLLSGYLYAHWMSEHLSPAAQNRLHLAMLALAVVLVIALSLMWPSAITPSAFWKPAGSGTPVRHLVSVLLVSAGFPFFVLSTTGPLLQRWFARCGESAKTYRLYSVSNLGSLLGLLSFPFVFEPVMRITQLGRLWAILFCLFAVGCAECARRAGFPTAVVDDIPSQTSSSDVETTSAIRALWVLLAGCASALLLATTNLLCQEVTSIPLLWVVPLSLYLLSFILCFDHPRWYRREVFHPLCALGIFSLWATMHFALRTPQVILLPLLLFVTCMICHGELVRLKPRVERLTGFYLAISTGGALGGIFVAIVAPTIFRFFTEYQLSLSLGVLLLLACLFRDGSSWIYRERFWTPAAMLVAMLAAAYLGSQWIPQFSDLLVKVRFYPLLFLLAVLVLLGAYMQRPAADDESKRFLPGQAVVIVLAMLAWGVLYESAQAEKGLYLGKRNFYGALRVYELGQGGKALFHGQTLHGAQLDPPNDHLPMAYYGPDSGIGILLQNHSKRVQPEAGLRLGIVGLGAGTLAAYGTHEDYLRYYEINPDVVKLSAGAQPVFTYIRDSQAKVDVELGDARLLLEREASDAKLQNFDVLVLDAFSGDAVPVHLLTTEAFDTYWKHVNPEHGIIAIHLSSRHINLMPVVEGTAAHFHARMLPRFVPGSYPFLDNLWVFLARRPEDVDISGLVPNPPPISSRPEPRVWTDDYSNILRLLY
jgi:hypothetical protein